MAILEITVSNKATGEIKAREIFEIPDDETARLFLAQFEKMLAGFERPIRVVKTISPGGVTTIDIITQPYLPPPVVSPTFEERFRRPSLRAPLPEEMP